MYKFNKYNKDGTLSISYLKYLNKKKNWFYPLKIDRESKILNNQYNRAFEIYNYNPIIFKEIIKLYNSKIQINQLPLFFDQIKKKIPYSLENINNSNNLVNNSCSNLHIGQRKLLITEVLFLSMYNLQYFKSLSKNDLIDNLPKDKKIPIVIYAGAAHGTHLLELLKLFPGIVFHNYDRTNFDHNLVTNNYKFPNNFLFQELFLESHINKYTKLADEGYLIYFISDIRSSYSNFITKNKQIKNENKLDSEFEECVKYDNILMESFITKIKPISCLFKFRLPYNTNKIYNYLEGKIMLQPWSKDKSNECRLIIENLNNNRDKKYKYNDYDKNNFEDTFYYLNIVLKYYGFYNHSIPCSGYYPYDKYENNDIEKFAIGFDHTYNCSFEIIAWCVYLGFSIDNIQNIEQINKFINDNKYEIIKLINETTSLICRNLNINCHGLLPNKTNLEKLEFFTNEYEKNQFDKRLKVIKKLKEQDIKCLYQYVKKDQLFFLKDKTFKNKSLKDKTFKNNFKNKRRLENVIKNQNHIL